MSELTDEQICNIARSTQTAEPGRDGYILPVAFARAVIAADRGLQDADIKRLRADEKRMDWLADKDNHIGKVELPTEYVMANMHSLRASIDMAMKEKS